MQTVSDDADRSLLDEKEYCPNCSGRLIGERSWRKCVECDWDELRTKEPSRG